MKKLFLDKFKSSIVSTDMTTQIVGGRHYCKSGSLIVECNGGTCSAKTGCLSCSGGSNDGGNAGPNCNSSTGGTGSGS